jgi:hypothetical protein
MQLTGPQSDILLKMINDHFGGEKDSAEEFADFVLHKLDIDIVKNGWVNPNDKFHIQASGVLKKLRGEALSRFLDVLDHKLIEDAGENEETAAVASIKKQLLESPDASGRDGMDADTPLPRKILVAAGPVEKPFAEKVKRQLQNIMKDFEVIGTWENRYQIPDDLEKIWTVIALIVVISPQKEVKDPPLRAIRGAFDRLNASRRVVILTLTPSAQAWIENAIKDIELKDCIQTEVFFGEDGRPIFIDAPNNEYVGISIDYRVNEIAEKLQALFDAAGSQSGAAARGPLGATTADRGAASVILLGEPLASSPESVARSIDQLKEALSTRGTKFTHWPDGWFKVGARPSQILLGDPVFVSAAADEDTDTKRRLADLENALSSVFDPQMREALLTCRKVLWRSAGPAWTLLSGNSDPRSSSDDLDNIETRVAKTADFAQWLERYILPDITVLHEEIGPYRPPSVIRVLRDAIAASLPASNRKPVIRLRAFSELPDFDADRPTIVAVDDLPVAAGTGHREKAIQRLTQFDYRIDNILDQKRGGVDDAPLLRVAMLIQDPTIPDPDGSMPANRTHAWTPFRVNRDAAMNFHAEAADVAALGLATASLIARATPSPPSAGKNE